ncbi:MAG: phosphotransferase [Bacilli bacterium]|jgi:thiamine kinase-like enzyme|nr:phosphotransferase [Bacilli bacterium]
MEKAQVTRLTKQGEDFLFKLGLGGKEIIPINKGISNNNYLIDRSYVLKVPFDKKFITFSQDKKDLQDLASTFFLSPKIIAADFSSGLILTKFLKDFTSLNPQKTTLMQAHNLILGIKKLHSLSCPSLKELDYQGMLNFYRLLTPPKERVYNEHLESSSLLKAPKEITHFDLVDNNLLFDSNGAFRLIDYEFACLAPRFFDLISLLYENDFPKEIESLLIELYFEKDEESKKEFLLEKEELKAIADLLWYHWAYARSQDAEGKGKEAFKEIAAVKKASLFSWILKQN